MAQKHIYDVHFNISMHKYITEKVRYMTSYAKDKVQKNIWNCVNMTQLVKTEYRLKVF